MIAQLLAGLQPAREQRGAGVDLAGDVELALVDEAGRDDPLPPEGGKDLLVQRPDAGEPEIGTSERKVVYRDGDLPVRAGLLGGQGERDAPQQQGEG